MHYGWTLDKAAWTKLITVTRDRAWRKVSFSRLEKAQVPTEGGVYVFCAKPMSVSVNATQRHLLRTLLNAVYVGQAVNLRKRFDDHLRTPMDPMRRCRAVFSTTLEFWFTSRTFCSRNVRTRESSDRVPWSARESAKGANTKGQLGVGRPA